eukprot:2463689-Amphidinium_carterae.1
MSREDSLQAWYQLVAWVGIVHSERTYRFSYHPVSELTKNFGKSALSEDDDIGDCPGIALAAGGNSNLS